MLKLKARLYEAREYSYYLLLFLLPLSAFAPNLVLALLVVLTLIQDTLNWRSFLTNSLVLFVFYCGLNGVLSGTYKTELNIYLRLLPLILIPFSFSKLSQRTLIKGYFYLFISVLLIQISAFYGIIEYYYFTEGKKVALRSYSGINDILRFERPYLGFLSAIQILIGCNLLLKKKKFLYLVPMIISTVIIYIISARLAIIIAISCSTIYLFLQLKKSMAKWVFVIGIPLIAVSFLILSNTALKHRFLQIKNDSRMIIWNGGLQQFQNMENKLFGLSSQKLVDEGQEDYYKYDANFEYPPDKIRFLDKNYNMHNQFLNELLRGGYLGLLLLIAPIFIAFISLDYKKYPLALSMLVAITMFLFVENVLERQLGVYLTGIILANAVIKKD